MSMGNNHRNQNEKQTVESVSSPSHDGVEKPNANFIPQGLANKMGKDGCKRLECINELAKHRTAEVFSVIDQKTLNWMYENLTSSGIEMLVSRIAQTIPDDEHMDEYWGIRKPYFDFRRIKFHDSDTQIAIVRSLVLLDENTLSIVVSHGKANLWPLACFGWANSHTIEWIHKLSPEKAQIIIDRMSHKHVWPSHSLLDVIAILTAWDETLMERSHLWVYWQILYTCVQSGLAFRLAVRDCSNEVMLQDYRVMALAALPNIDAVREFESCLNMNATANDALEWFVDRLKAHPANCEVTQPLWFWEEAQSIGLKYGTQLIWPNYA